MATLNYATQIRRELLTRISKLLLEDQLVEKIDRIPVEMRPRHRDTVRCCVHKERAVLKYRLMALLGFNCTDEVDELMPISEYAQQAVDRTEYTEVMLTVVDDACSSCIRNSYIVSNLCRGCVGRPCTFSCKKDAIAVTDKAFIDPEKCINCGQCMTACPYHAIIYQPIPCEESCPVGAIKKNENNIEVIDDSKCIYCGKCMVACPFGAIMEKSYLIEIIRALKSDKRVVAMVAPAILGQYKTDFGRILSAIKKVGFTDVMEVAKGADMTTAHETEEFIERMHEGAEFMTTSCCPSWVHLAEKHIPEIKPYVSSTLSPMGYAAQIVKKEDPNAIAVFVAPCVGKRSEVYHNPLVDYVISFEELDSLFQAAGVVVEECEEMPLDNSIHNSSRKYAYLSGVVEAVKEEAGENATAIKSVLIDGITQQNIRALRSFAKSGKCPDGNLVEVMSCPGGCVNGCDVINQAKLAARQIQTFTPKE